MIRFRAFGVQFSLPLVTIAAPFLAGKLGMRSEILPLALALGAHELAHLAAAHFTGVAITEIRLLPFGGSARMENPYRLALRQVVPVAAAGPVANFLLAACTAAFAHWGLMKNPAPFVRVNLVLCLFNLLPALPLDGGRILFALAARPWGEKKALAAGLWSGRIFSAGLLGLTLAGGSIRGVWNLSFIFAALFILASGRDERCALYRSRAQQLSDLLSSDLTGRPARLWQLDASEKAIRALNLLRPREPGFFMLTRNGKPAGMLSAQDLLRFLVNGGAPDTALGDLPAFSLPPRSAPAHGSIIH